MSASLTSIAVIPTSKMVLRVIEMVKTMIFQVILAKYGVKV